MGFGHDHPGPAHLAHLGPGGLDGNGRVGRLLVTLFLLERKRLSQPLLYLSAFIDAHKDDYYDLLQRVRLFTDFAGASARTRGTELKT